MSQPLLSISHLTKKFGDNVILNDVCFDVKQGEVIVVIGPSGCGKSTLLRCINALEPIQGGKITLGGDVIDRSASNLPALRRRIGMVFQSYELFPHLTVIDNILLAPCKVLRRKREEAREEACRRGGIPLDPRLVDALGPLSSIVEHDADGLAAQDVAWELGPLAVMRACLPQEAWENLVAASGSRDGLVAALDSLMASLAVENPLLSLLPNLSYESSVLDFERLSRWCASLGAVASTDIVSGHIRAVFDLAAGAQAVPAEVGRLVASVAASHLEKGSAAATPRFYLPCAAADCLSDIPASVDARADCSCQCCDTEALIQACLVRAVAARPTPDAGMLVGVARGHSALLEDAFAAERADVVLCEVCDPFVPWAEKPPRRDDPRWSVGVPTRMRPTFAWLEHCLFHSAPGGISINLIPTSELETHKPVDSEILSRLALEGHVAAAAVLPARIWGDGRPPMSLVVLRGQASAAPCLMVDASCLGKQRSDLAPLLPNPQRCFGGPAFEGVCALLSTWFAEGRLLEVADIPARLVAPQELLAAGGSISPWTYLSAGQHQNAC